MHINLPDDLVKQGSEILGSEHAFLRWMEKENFFFDKKAPNTLVNSDGGIKFIKDRLVAMNYGDNV